MAVRINTKISDEANEWLDRKSVEMALTKSALVNMAVENYKKEMETLAYLPAVMRKLEELELLALEKK